MAKGDSGGGALGIMKSQGQGMGGFGQNMGRMGGMMGGMMQNGQFGGQKQMPSFNAGPTPIDAPAERMQGTGEIGSTREDLQKQYVQTGGREGTMGGFNPGNIMRPQVMGPNGETPNQMAQQGQNRLAQMFQQMRGQNQGNQFGQQQPQQGGMFGPNQPPAWGQGGRFGGQQGGGMMRGLFGAMGGGRRF